ARFYPSRSSNSSKEPCLNPDFPNNSVASAWRLRVFPANPSVSDHYPPKRPRNPMDESQTDVLRVDFDPKINLEFHACARLGRAGMGAGGTFSGAIVATVLSGG